MDYGNRQDPTFYDATYYEAQYYGLAGDKDTGSQPWYTAAPGTQRRRSSGQVQASLCSEDELDRYATIRPSTARPGVPPVLPLHGELRRKSTNLDRYISLSESANAVSDYAAVSEQRLQYHQQPRLLSHLAQIPEVPPLNARLAVSEDRMTAFEPPLPFLPPLSMQIPQVFATIGEPPEALAAQEKKSAKSERWTQNVLSRSPVMVRSDPKAISSLMASSLARAKKIFRSDERGDRSWATPRQDAMTHSLPLPSVEELLDAMPVQNAEVAELSCPTRMMQEDMLPPPMELSRSQSSHASESSSEPSSTASSSTETSYDSEASQSASGYGGTASKSTRFSNNEKSPASCYGTPSSLPTPSSTSLTTAAVKTPEAVASAFSKNSPSASKKSREHRSTSKTPQSSVRTPPGLHSKAETPPSIAATREPLSFRSRSRSPAASTKTYSAPRSLSRTATSLPKTPPVSANTATPPCRTPPPSPRTPPSILRTPQRSSAKTVSSRTQAMVAEVRERMLSSGLYESATKAMGTEHGNHRSNSSGNQEEAFHSEQSAQCSTQPPVLQRLIHNKEQSMRISMGRFPSSTSPASRSLPRESSSHRGVVIPKYIPHSIALIQRDGATSVTKVPVMSLSVPVAKAAQAAKDHAVGVAPATRLMRTNYDRSHSSSMGRDSLVMYMNKFPATRKEHRRSVQKALSAHATSKRKSRSSKAIQHPDLIVGMPYVETLESSNFQSSEASTGRPLISPTKEKSKSDGSMLMHLCVAINVILFSALSGIVFAYFLHVGAIKKM